VFGAFNFNGRALRIKCRAPDSPWIFAA
jgi:hypothetical protein